ncbi:MAG: sensor histidine kinase [Bdellovibrionales bacterium]
MNSSKLREALKLLSIVMWLVFTVVFALWWFKFSVDSISLLAKLEPEQLEHWQRQRRMIFWEGTSWIILLIIGGAALIALVQRERWRVRRIREFFASFSHEIKTSLASLRVQAEALKDELENVSSPILDRLIGDTVRLQLQLENSLFLASQDNLQLYIQPLQLQELLERMREQWPGLKIDLKRACTIQADERALRTILSNLLQNAIVHGKATRVLVDPNLLNGKIEISVSDNGSGFADPVKNLGQLFHRPKPTSGSGIGLYICRMLVDKMNGKLNVVQSAGGFQIQVVLQGSVP